MLLLSGTSVTTAAPTLFTVTVKITPPQPDAQMVMYNLAKGLDKKYGCIGNGPAMVCKVISGRYKIAVFSNESSFKNDNVNNLIVNITKSQTIIYKVVLEKPPVAMSLEAAKPFNDLLIQVTGTLEECGNKIPQPDRKCATTDMDISLVKKWVGLVGTLRQLTAWEKGDNFSIASFDVNGKPYLMVLSRMSDGGTLLQWSR